MTEHWHILETFIKGERRRFAVRWPDKYCWQAAADYLVRKKRWAHTRAIYYDGSVSETIGRDFRVRPHSNIVSLSLG